MQSFSVGLFHCMCIDTDIYVRVYVYIYLYICVCLYMNILNVGAASWSMYILRLARFASDGVPSMALQVYMCVYMYVCK